MKKSAHNSIWKSFVHAFEGILSSLKAEKNLVIHFIIMALVITFGLIFEITKGEWITCVILFALVISLELINTSIEMVTDICKPEISPQAKFCKDVAAGAVLVCAIASAIIGLIIFIPYLG